MSLQQAKNYLKQFNREQDIIEFDVSSATVELAAKALNCAPERIAKTLSFKINERAILIVTAGDVKIDNRKYKETRSEERRVGKRLCRSRWSPYH